jgi:hypothetical protein
MISVKFTTHGANSAFGAFGPGDTARVSPELAKHFVEISKCAKYIDAPEKVEVMAEKPVLTVKKSKK